MGRKICRLDHYCPLASIHKIVGSKEESSAFLDSSLHNRYGRYSILGCHPYLRLEETAGLLKVNGRDQEGDLLQYLREYLKEEYEENPTDLPMVGGAIGYLSYDYGRKFENLPSRHPKELKMPDALFQFYDLYLIEDLEKREIWISTGEKLHQLQDYLGEVEELISSLSVSTGSSHAAQPPLLISSDFTEQDYKRAIEEMIEYIRAGDIYVANMTRQIQVKSKRDPLEVFQYLRTHNPSPFGAYLKEKDYQIISASPERFLQVRQGLVETRPIKGTRRRGETEEEDQLLRRELEDSQKDRSELLMIVDLERNDLNRVCRPGSVVTKELFVTEAYATVFHLVSTIEGHLREEKGITDLLQVAFPGGSITGAPKIRAMEIIDQLEHSSRGLYTGSIGYISLDGDCDLNIVIRTAIYQEGTYHIGAGGGITVESQPDFEYEETRQKAKAVIEAIAGGKSSE